MSLATQNAFTTKGADLFAIALGWPESGSLTVRSLAAPAGADFNRIESVSLLGYEGDVAWKQTADGLIVSLPSRKISEYTAALKIRGCKLIPQPVPVD